MDRDKLELGIRGKRERVQIVREYLRTEADLIEKLTGRVPDAWRAVEGALDELERYEASDSVQRGFHV